MEEAKYICHYCGKLANFQLNNGNWCCCKNYQSCPSIKKKNRYKQIQRVKNGKYGLSEWNQKIKKGEVFTWNKGLSKETDQRILKVSKKLVEKHKNKQLKVWSEGKKLSYKTRDKISNSMKKSHAEGRAHNIGQCRWKNKPSYPEQFFIEVIKNEFIDKKYQRQYPFFKYSIDFAWVNKKLAIEIDGQQHEKDICQKERDRCKQNLLRENGWNVLRIKWKDMYNNSKYWINIAKKFVDNT